MRIISRRALREFWEIHTDARKALEAWYIDTKQAEWKTPSDIKNVYRNVSFVANNRVVFNIKGNRYRLVVVVVYKSGIVYIRFVGTHSEYDKIDATRI
ncbi:MAG TPA: type II toxin-antitoxin system HigB family toxin [Anaerolineae bacterium]|nr:type II toxin-antitoxin system HigB family toxin [Anaerolineae bacterium]HIP71072.1 type II toxin-antitoxin system HigB family toxin [Anaerolineae bacterium]